MRTDWYAFWYSSTLRRASSTSERWPRMMPWLCQSLYYSKSRESWFFSYYNSFILPYFSFSIHSYRSFHLTSSRLMRSFSCSRKRCLMRTSYISPSLSYSYPYNFFFSRRQLFSKLFISLSFASHTLLSSTFSLFTPFTAVLSFWLTELSSSFCFLSLKISLSLSSFSSSLCLRRSMQSFICPFRSSTLPFNFPYDSLRSSLVSVRQCMRSSCFWLRMRSFCISKVDSCSLLLKSLSLPLSLRVMQEKSEVSLATSLMSESWSFWTPNSWRRLMVCSLILKKISSFLILNKFSNLSTLLSEYSLRCSNSFSNSPGYMYFFNLSISPSQRCANSRIFSSFVSFSFLRISMVRLDSPRRKVLARTFSSPSKAKYLLAAGSEGGRMLEDLTRVRPLLILLGDWTGGGGGDGDLGRRDSRGFFSSGFGGMSLLSLQICLICDRYSASISFILSCLAWLGGFFSSLRYGSLILLQHHEKRWNQTTLAYHLRINHIVEEVE